MLTLRVQRDRFNVMRGNVAVAWGAITSDGKPVGIEMEPFVRKSNPARLSVLRMLTTDRLADAYYRAEDEAARELGKPFAYVDDLAEWAKNNLMDRHAILDNRKAVPCG